MGGISRISLAPGRSAEDIATEIRAACLKNGFFQVTDYYHIVPRDLPGQTLAAARDFFNLPLFIKQGLHKADHVAGGYEPYKIMNLNPSDPMGYGHNEGFSFAAEPSPTAWPSTADLPRFKQIMQSYYEAVTDLAKSLGRFLALGLNLPDDYFDNFYQGQLAHVKLAHYYRPEGFKASETDVGVAPHTDWGAITILLQDEIGGLEVFDQESSEWIKVSPIPDAFVINLGDLLARWTNDEYKSTKHRVISPPPGIHRYSIPFFSQGHPDYIVRTIETCLKDGEQAKYGSIRAEDYLKLKFESTYNMKTQ
ncbi:Clavaminate synthase-like protein [Serendipita vermifera]|nr:Clavaminate synthase-like protein [Serendipita vermifera]